MPKIYDVEITEFTYNRYTVEADSEADARAKAWRRYEFGKADKTHSHSDVTNVEVAIDEVE